MEISVTDGLTVTTSEVKVEVSLSENRGPRLAPGSSLSMTVASQQTAIITRANLAYVVSSDIHSLALCTSDWAPRKLHVAGYLRQQTLLLASRLRVVLHTLASPSISAVDK